MLSVASLRQARALLASSDVADRAAVGGAPLQPTWMAVPGLQRHRADPQASYGLSTQVSALGPEDQSAALGTLDACAGGAHVSVRVIGQVHAGNLNSTEAVFDDVFLLPKQIVGEGDLFMLRVVGDSMIDAAIEDGNWVVVRQQPNAENGEIVVAMIDGEATVKAFSHSSDRIWLVPHNPKYQKIQGDRAVILGKVVAVVRRI